MYIAPFQYMYFVRKTWGNTDSESIEKKQKKTSCQLLIFPNRHHSQLPPPTLPPPKKNTSELSDFVGQLVKSDRQLVM